MLFLLLGSASAAAAASLTLLPYTDLAPQKIMLNQVPRRLSVGALSCCLTLLVAALEQALSVTSVVEQQLSTSTCTALHELMFTSKLPEGSGPHPHTVSGAEQVHSHGPGATAAGSFDGGGGANGTSSAGFEASTDAITRSVWAITSFDSGPVQRALPDLGWTPAASQPRDMQVGRVSGSLGQVAVPVSRVGLSVFLVGPRVLASRAGHRFQTPAIT